MASTFGKHGGSDCFGRSSGKENCSEILKRSSSSSSKLTLRAAAARVSSHLLFVSSSQHTPSVMAPTAPFAMRLEQRVNHTSSQPSRHMRRNAAAAVVAAVGRRSKSAGGSTPDGDTALLLQDGFTPEQAATLLERLIRNKRTLSIDNVREWVLLLRTVSVNQPEQVISTNPIILGKRADHSVSSGSAAAAAEWMGSKGLTPFEVSKVISAFPMILNVSPASLAATDAWLRIELRWTSDMTKKALHACPELFALRPSNLAPKLDWFRMTGFSDEAISSMLIKCPNLLTVSVERNQSLVSALQLLGLSRDQVLLLIFQMPSLLRKNISSATQQAKVRFLLEVMQRDILELTTCTAYFTYSLFNRIGPRWAFVALYCEDAQTRKLGGMLSKGEISFLEGLKSASMDEACSSRGLTHAQLFQRFVVEWQEGEGKEWCVKDEKKWEV